MLGKKICVIGCGNWGQNHIQTLDSLNSLGGIVDSNKDIINNLSEKYPYIKAFTNLSEALKSSYFDGFIVATPAESHYSIAKKILEAKKHVLVEKPLTLDINHAEELNKLSISNNVNLMVGHLMIFHQAINKIKELIINGELGNLQYIYSNRLNLGIVRRQENVFWSLAPHDISIFQYLTESYPTSIKSHGCTFLQEGIFDSTITQLKYPNEVEGHIFVSWLHPFKEQRLVVIGSEAMITFEDSSEEKPLRLYSKKINMRSGIPEKIDGPVKEIKYRKNMPLTEELVYFINHLNGDKIKLCNGVHALEVTKILVEASNYLEGKR